jgi:hypothetical protein
MKAGFQVDLEKAKQAHEIAKDSMTAAASEMFAFYWCGACLSDSKTCKKKQIYEF